MCNTQPIPKVQISPHHQYALPRLNNLAMIAECMWTAGLESRKACKIHMLCEPKAGVLGLAAFVHISPTICTTCYSAQHGEYFRSIQTVIF